MQFLSDLMFLRFPSSTYQGGFVRQYERAERWLMYSELPISPLSSAPVPGSPWFSQFERPGAGLTLVLPIRAPRMSNYSKLRSRIAVQNDKILRYRDINAFSCES